MVLGCLMMLMLSLSLMMSFSVANAVHERIRIQSHADAMAFSMAVVEARTMNYLAYSNRAIAAAFVSMTSVHAYGAIASSAVTLMEGMRMAMVVALIAEVAKCASKRGMCHCCLHAIQLIIRIVRYQRTISNYRQKVKNLEQPFNNTVRAFVQLADAIHRSQQFMVTAAGNIIAQGKGDFDRMRQHNAPCAQPGIPGAVGALNTRNFACAMEGSVLDMAAINCPSSASELDNRRRIMSNVVNAARPQFLNSTHIPFIAASSSAFGPLVFKQDFLKDLMTNIPKLKFGFGMTYKVEGWLADQACREPNYQSKGDASCAQAGDGTFFIIMPIDMPGFGTVSNAMMASNKGGGSHKPSSAHSGQHQEYKGLFSNGDGFSSCLMGGNCFINHRLDKEDDEWGQPAVYAHIRQSLRDWTTSANACNTERHAWEINEQSTVTLNHGEHGQVQLRMVPERDGTAVSKALVYFHRVDDWKFPPNLFDPYWRAKLHPWNTGEREIVVVVGGGI